MNYKTFKYIYPPRPEYKTKPEFLGTYDDGSYYAMPKYNGSACVIFTNGKELFVYNRHKEVFSNYSNLIEFRKLAKTNKWFVYAGEYLNKGKTGETGIKEKDKFVIWDLLVWDGVYLVGSTLEERLTLLEKIYPCKRAIVDNTGIEIYEHLCCTEFRGIYKAPIYLNNFSNLYENLVNTDLYEGIVLKKRQSKLSFGFNELNNAEWQIKCRKENKLYNF